MGNPAEAAAETRPRPDDDDTEAPPPPYQHTARHDGEGPPTPVASSQTPGPSSSAAPTDGDPSGSNPKQAREARVRMSRTTTPYRPLPATLSAYCQVKVTRTMHLGDSSDHKLFATSIFYGITGKGPGVLSCVVYNGPDDKAPALAISADESPSREAESLRSIITLPLMRDGKGDGGKGDDDEEEEEEEGEEQDGAAGSGSGSGNKLGVAPNVAREVMQHGLADGDDDQVVFRFAIEVSVPSSSGGSADGTNGKGAAGPAGEKRGGRRRREVFEWRMAAKQDVDFKGYAGGARLFRRRSSGNGDGDAGNDDDTVLATVYWKSRWVVNKPFTLRFAEAARAGHMGDRWAVMVLATGLRVYVLSLQGRVGSRHVASAISAG